MAPSSGGGGLVLEEKKDPTSPVEGYAALGGRVWTFRLDPKGAGPVAAAPMKADFGKVAALALDDRDGLLVSDEAAGRVVRLGRGEPHARTSLASGLDRPRGVAFRRLEGRPEVLVAEATRGIGLAGPSLEIGGLDPKVPLELKLPTAEAEGTEKGAPLLAGFDLAARVTPADFVPADAAVRGRLQWSWRVVEMPKDPSGGSAELPAVVPAEAWKGAEGFPVARGDLEVSTELVEGGTRIRFVPPLAIPDGARVVVSVRLSAPPYDDLVAETPSLVVRRPQAAR